MSNPSGKVKEKREAKIKEWREQIEEIIGGHDGDCDLMVKTWLEDSHPDLIGKIVCNCGLEERINKIQEFIKHAQHEAREEAWKEVDNLIKAHYKQSAMMLKALNPKAYRKIMTLVIPKGQDA